MTKCLRTFAVLIRLIIAVGVASSLGACAHSIVISPLETPRRNDQTLCAKNVAYVMTDADRNKQVTTEGGGGDKVSYLPFRDLEKAIRDALKAIYSDVSVIRSPNDAEFVKENNISFIFAPEIYTSSNSNSAFTWPPTQFNIELACTVTDPIGNIVSRIRVLGTGTAEYSEFKSDFGLAGRRAATNLSEKFREEIQSNPRLR